MKFLIILFLLTINSCSNSQQLDIFLNIKKSKTNCYQETLTLDGVEILTYAICDKKEFIKRGCDLGNHYPNIKQNERELK